MDDKEFSQKFDSALEDLVSDMNDLLAKSGYKLKYKHSKKLKKPKNRFWVRIWPDENDDIDEKTFKSFKMAKRYVKRIYEQHKDYMEAWITPLVPPSDPSRWQDDWMWEPDGDNTKYYSWDKETDKLEQTF